MVIVAKRGSDSRSGRLDRADEFVPELVGHAHDKQPAVGGRKGLHRGDGIMRAPALAHRDMPFIEIPGGDVTELMQRDVEQASIDVATLADDRAWITADRSPTAAVNPEL